MELLPGLHAFVWTKQNANNCNTYYIDVAPRALVDPGHVKLFGHVDMGMQQAGLNLPAVSLITHGHPDHLEAALALQRQGVKLAMHPAEDEYLKTEGRQLATAMGMKMPDIIPDIFLEEGELNLGGATLEVYHTPGHSPGHISLYWPRHKALFCGDLIFAQGVGRVDFPGGDGQALKASIDRMAELDLEWLLSGHGPIIKGKANIQRNFEIIRQVYYEML